MQSAIQPTQNKYSPATQGLLGPAIGALAGGAGVGLGNQFGGQWAGQSPMTY